MKQFLPFLLALLLISTISSCKKEQSLVRTAINIPDKDAPGDLKINQLQYLGSHNSYRTTTDADILDFISTISGSLPAEFNPLELDYTHTTITNQMTNHGIRQLELDLYLDTDGGRFYNRRGYSFVGKDVASGIDDLKEPGIKIIHIPDVDFNTHNISFKGALNEVKNWSAKYPEHIPVFILLELKETTINDFLSGVGFAEIEKWDNIQALNSLENEILDVFNREDLITPDEVRGSYNTLNEAVLANNWPTIDDSRGKIMFLFDNEGVTDLYTTGNPSLENKLIFTNGVPGDEDAAFVKENNSSRIAKIQDLVSQGYIVRTRTDAGTYEARENDYSTWNDALESGAQFLSTDYYVPDPRAGDGVWSSYQVQFNNSLYRINPVTNP